MMFGTLSPVEIDAINKEIDMLKVEQGVSINGTHKTIKKIKASIWVGSSITSQQKIA